MQINYCCRICRHRPASVTTDSGDSHIHFFPVHFLGTQFFAPSVFLICASARNSLLKLTFSSHDHALIIDQSSSIVKSPQKCDNIGCKRKVSADLPQAEDTLTQFKSILAMRSWLQLILLCTQPAAAKSVQKATSRTNKRTAFKPARHDGADHAQRQVPPSFMVRPKPTY
jgi:hypothetical protein